MKIYHRVLSQRIFHNTELRQSPPGFTLIELMIAIAILAIMLVAAIPAVNSYMTKHALQYATDELYGDIQLARMRAARNNQRCRILFNKPTANQYTIQDFDNNGLFISDVKIGDLNKFRSGVSFTNSPNAANPPPLTSLEFMPQGIRGTIAPAGSNSVYMTNQDNNPFYRVLVSAAGGTDVDRWNSNTNQWR